MSEMLKDLEKIDAEAADMLLDMYPGRYVKHVADRLEELGYVKVVRCRECKHYEDCNHWLPILEENLWFCSAGERVVADATGKEVPNA